MTQVVMGYLYTAIMYMYECSPVNGQDCNTCTHLFPQEVKKETRKFLQAEKETNHTYSPPPLSVNFTTPALQHSYSPYEN